MTLRRDKMKRLVWLVVGLSCWCQDLSPVAAEDRLRDLQTSSVSNAAATWGHWGTNSGRLTNWTSHTNRLVPVYTFGWSLDAVQGPQSVYRQEHELRRLYGRVPAATLNPTAEYFDQTDIYRIQQQAAAAGKKYLILLVFDGMDWPTARAAAVAQTGAVKYREGRGTGLHFQDYRGTTTDYGYIVTSPHNDGTTCDVDAQTVSNPGGTTPGGFDWQRAGTTPWAMPADSDYLIGKSRDVPHAVTDSASAATSLTAGIKTYNDAINVDAEGKQVETIAHQLQRQGYAIGIVSNVPISHATPACGYAHNVHRDDYQDLTRDMLGLPSISHREQPLPGVDVLLGAGWGVDKQDDKAQGQNYVPGNRYIAPPDLAAIDLANGGQYRVVQRTAGQSGPEVLSAATRAAVAHRQKLFGLFGYSASGHLPFRTADGRYDPTVSVALKDDKITAAPAEQYSPEDLRENPTLADFARSALDVLAARSDRFWLLVEAGDVDWANHSNNIDNSIGAVISGDEAFRAITDWVEARQAWDQTAIIVTADHGHYLVLDHPEELAAGTAAPTLEGSSATGK